MYELKTRILTRNHVFHAYMVSIRVEKRVSTRNRPIHIKYLGRHLGCQTLAHPKC